MFFEQVESSESDFNHQTVLQSDSVSTLQTSESLDVRIWRLYTSECDVYRRHSDVYIRQNLTSIDVRFWRLKSIPALEELKKL